MEKINLIGISGYMGSGKDAVATIIKTLTRGDSNYSQIIEGKIVSIPGNITWHNKKFAGNLKKIVSLLTGITIDSLEREDIKNSYLPSEWDIPVHWLPVGSDRPLKEGQYWDKSTESEALHPCWIIMQKMKVRELLQKLGTDAMRNIVHYNIHVNALFTQYILQPHGGITRDLKYPNWIISDLRFPNEAKAIKDRGGITIRVNRPELGEIKKVRHSSETSLDNYNFDYVIDNVKDLTYLQEQVYLILQDLKILT